MKERPILFNGDMVRAILSGQKTQTRRVVKAKHLPWLENSVLNFLDGKWNQRPFPYGNVGDRLWVRETWAETDLPCGTPVATYRAGGCIPIGRQREINTDFLINQWATSETHQPEKWQPSIHMPRWASRITLEITGVRVERLRDISIRDAIREGIVQTWGDFMGRPPKWAVDSINQNGDGSGSHVYDNRTSAANFFQLWASIYGPDSVRANPWVWVIEFKRIATSEKN